MYYYFICNSHSPLETGRSQTHTYNMAVAIAWKINWLNITAFLPGVPVLVSKTITFNLGLCVSASSALMFHHTSVDSFRAVTSLCYLQSFHSQRRIIILFLFS